MQLDPHTPAPHPSNPQRTRLAPLSAALLLCAVLPLQGCIVAGYSSGSGLWIWPGSIVITLLLVLFYLLTRHR